MTEKAKTLLELEDDDVREIILALLAKDPVTFPWKEFNITVRWDYFEDGNVGEVGFSIEVNGPTEKRTLEFCMDPEMYELDETDSALNYKREIQGIVKMSMNE